MSEQRQLDSREVDKVGDWARRGIWIVGTVLATFFAFLQLNDLPYIPAINGANPLYIREILLAIYYLCWVFGSSFDVSIQRHVYIADPLRGEMPKRAIAIITMLLIVAAVLLWVRDSDKLFAAVLAALLVVNMIGFAFIQTRIKPMITSSRNSYHAAKDYFSMAQLDTVDEYMCGNWQWWRFAAIAIILAVTNTISFWGVFRENIANWLHRARPDLSETSASQLLPALMLLIFILVSEIWIWYRRANAKARIEALEELRKTYTIAVR